MGQVPGKARIAVQESPDYHLESLKLPGYALIKQGYLRLSL